MLNCNKGSIQNRNSNEMEIVQTGGRGSEETYFRNKETGKSFSLILCGRGDPKLTNCIFNISDFKFVL